MNTTMLQRILPQIKQLDELIGMTNLKLSMLTQIKYYLQGMHNRGTGDFMNTCITGSPGCGKSTVARIIAELYKNMGVLSPEGSFKSVGRADLIGGYLGQTAIKTQNLLNSCLGGVLFIDEVYSLGSGVKTGNQDSYSKECADTMTQFLSEHKHNFCLIIAGYQEKINSCFFSLNQGLKRRFAWNHNIDEYSSEDLARIALKFVRDIRWETDVSVAEMTTMVHANKQYLKYLGGSIEAWVAKTKLEHSDRVFSENYSQKYTLSKKDFENGLERIKDLSKDEIKDIKLDMYM